MLKCLEFIECLECLKCTEFASIVFYLASIAGSLRPVPNLFGNHCLFLLHNRSVLNNSEGHHLLDEVKGQGLVERELDKALALFVIL